MSAEAALLLDAALTDLEACLRAHHPPTRHHARAVLVPLGESLLENDMTGVAAAVGRLQKAVEGDPAAWQRAVEDELLMACTEHVRSVDPRHLEHPAYDFEYSLEARKRLGARLRAADEIGFRAADALLDGVARADRMLALAWARRSGTGEREG